MHIIKKHILKHAYKNNRTKYDQVQLALFKMKNLNIVDVAWQRIIIALTPSNTPYKIPQSIRKNNSNTINTKWKSIYKSKYQNKNITNYYDRGYDPKEFGEGICWKKNIIWKTW